MILSDGEIKKAIEAKEIIIDPTPNEDQYSSTAVDFYLGEYVTELTPENEIVDDLDGSVSTRVIIDPSHEDFNAKNLLRKYERKKTLTPEGIFILSPGEFNLAYTREKLILPYDSKIAARIEGRSSLARLGIGVHITAPIIHSGWGGEIKLEIFNYGPYQIVLKPNKLIICQIVFERVGSPPENRTPSTFATK